MLGIYLLFEKRYLLLLPLTFLFVWTYSLFVILPGMAFIWMCVIGWSERRFEWRPLVWALAGMIAGLVINPYFPRNIWLFVEHVLIKVTATGFTTDVGQEWYPYDSWFFLLNCIVAFAAMVVGKRHLLGSIVHAGVTKNVAGRSRTSGPMMAALPIGRPPEIKP